VGPSQAVHAVIGRLMHRALGLLRPGSAAAGRGGEGRPGRGRYRLVVGPVLLAVVILRAVPR
jgi:uncharacterized membrane protein